MRRVLFSSVHAGSVGLVTHRSVACADSDGEQRSYATLCRCLLRIAQLGCEKRNQDSLALHRMPRTVFGKFDLGLLLAFFERSTMQRCRTHLQCHHSMHPLCGIRA